MAVLFSQPATAITASEVINAFATPYDGVTTLAVDITISAVSGTGTPTMTLFLERQGADGNWYQIWTSAAQTATGAISLSMGPAMVGTNVTGATTAVGVVLTANARLRCTVSGTNPSFTTSVSIEGR